MKWGIFGGTFDPVHLGHLRCAEEIREAFALDKIIFVPAHRQPLKGTGAITPFPHRAEMLRLAIGENRFFELSDIEHRRGGTSYSIDTIEEFLSRGGKARTLYFITGQDAFQDIRLWKDWRRLLACCHFVVMTRPGYEPQSLEGILGPDDAAGYRYGKKGDCYRTPEGKSLYFRTTTFLDISSTDIRCRLVHGNSIRYLVPEPVRAYITHRRLYRRLQRSTPARHRTHR